MTTHTLIIRRSDESIESILLCNEKSRSKSIEQRELWIVDPETGRVLPYLNGGRRFDGFALKPGILTTPDWYETVLPDDPSIDETAEQHTLAPAAPKDTSAARNDSSPVSDTAAAAGSFLETLTAIIAERRRAMPEGSYTTHLFTKGESKIRKKTGEEAVELLLAENNEEILSEAADLIYHLMVFLEVRGLTIEQVIAHLRSRHEHG